MKLYYSPGSCSTASHIVLEESGVKFEIVRVNLKDKTMADGGDFNAVNPKGYVPTLRLDSGELLTENTALLEYLGELNPKALLPPAGTLERFRLREWLGYIATEVHKSCSPLFRPTTPEATVATLRALLARRLAYVELALAGKSYLMGTQFTVADAYLYVITTWFARIGIDLAAYPNLKAYSARVEARPAVQRALRDEGLLKAA